MYDISQLNELLVTELVDIADELNVSNSKKMNKSDLVKNIMDKQADNKNIPPTKASTPEVKKEMIARKKPENPKKSEANKPTLFDKDSESKKIEQEKKHHKKVAQPAADEAEEELKPITDEDTTLPPMIAKMLHEDETELQEPPVALIFRKFQRQLRHQ